jgi:hypothetical protein
MNKLSKTAKISFTIGAFVATLVLATVLPLALKPEKSPSSSNVPLQEENDAKTISSYPQSFLNNVTNELTSSNEQISEESLAIPVDPPKRVVGPNCVCFTSEDIDRTVSRLQISDMNYVTYFSKRSCTGTDRNGIYYTDTSYGYPAAYGMGVDIFNNDQRICIVEDMLLTVTPEEWLECKLMIENKCAEYATVLNNINNSQ